MIQSFSIFKSAFLSFYPTSHTNDTFVSPKLQEPEYISSNNY